jgi:hypothetical protein
MGFRYSAIPCSQTIQPRDPDTVNEELDSVLSPINLQGQTGCNCDLQPINLQGQTVCNCDLQPINSVCLVDTIKMCHSAKIMSEIFL